MCLRRTSQPRLTNVVPAGAKRHRALEAPMGVLTGLGRETLAQAALGATGPVGIGDDDAGRAAASTPRQNVGDGHLQRHVAG